MRAFLLAILTSSLTTTCGNTVPPSENVAAKCGAPIDVLFLQDTTESFGPFLRVVASQVPDIISTVLEGHPGSKFGAAEFKDRPFWALGFADDTCYNLMTPFTDNSLEIQKAYQKMDGSSGADTPEAHYFALVNAVYDPAIGWLRGRERAKLIILSTDASPHLPNDYILFTSDQYIATDWNQRQMPDYFPEHPGRPVNTDNFTEDCMTYDYPSYTQVKEALLSNDIFLAIFIPKGDKKVYSDWHWVNSNLLGQDDAFLNFVEMDGSGFAEAVEAAMEKVGILGCLTTTAQPETTTVTPTTESTTTTKETTTSATSTVPVTTSKTLEAIFSSEPAIPGCTEVCDCYKCTLPKSYIRFGERPESYSIKIRY